MSPIRIEQARRDSQDNATSSLRKRVPTPLWISFADCLLPYVGGVGSALIQYGNNIADTLGLFMWVHSSDQAWRAYAKFGFKVVGELDVDLDEYAPSPPEDEGMGGMWGRYVIRYMERLPNGSSAES
jgi:hypothetical protein